MHCCGFRILLAVAPVQHPPTMCRRSAVQNHQYGLNPLRGHATLLQAGVHALVRVEVPIIATFTAAAADGGAGGGNDTDGPVSSSSSRTRSGSSRRICNTSATLAARRAAVEQLGLQAAGSSAATPRGMMCAPPPGTSNSVDR